LCSVARVQMKLRPRRCLKRGIAGGKRQFPQACGNEECGSSLRGPNQEVAPAGAPKSTAIDEIVCSLWLAQNDGPWERKMEPKLTVTLKRVKAQ
jgi:hypothetical protein